MSPLAQSISKLVSGLTGTVPILKLIGCLYDGFGIHVKCMKKDKVTRQKTSQNLVRINNYFESAVAKVKEQ